MNKQDMILNQLAQNFATKLGQLEGEKALLQVTVHELQEKIAQLENKEVTE